MNNLWPLWMERSLTAVYKAVVVLHFWFVTSCRWESELGTWRSSLLQPNFLACLYLLFNETIQSTAASNSLFHTFLLLWFIPKLLKYMKTIYEGLNIEKVWHFAVGNFALVHLRGGVYCTVEPPVSSKKILMLSIHSMLPWKRLKATLPIYVNRRGEKKTTQKQRWEENRQIYSLIVVVTGCYVRRAKYRKELWMLHVHACTILLHFGDHFRYKHRPCQDQYCS